MSSSSHGISTLVCSDQARLHARYLLDHHLLDNLMDHMEEDFETLAIELMEMFLDHQDDDALANYRSSSKSHTELQVYAVHTKVST